MMHVTTYGRNIAAKCGDFLKYKVTFWPEAL